MVMAVRVLSVLATSSWLTPISPGSAVMRMASSGRGSRNVASMFQISHSLMLGSSLIFLVIRASIVFMSAGPQSNARKHICRFQFNRRLVGDDLSSAVELVYSMALLLV